MDGIQEIQITMTNLERQPEREASRQLSDGPAENYHWEDVLMDVIISYKMVKITKPGTDLHEWHKKRIINLEGIIKSWEENG